MDQVTLTPTTPEELLDSAWDRLDELAKAEGRKMRGSEVRYIGRDQLAEFMAEAGLLAIGASSLTEPDLSPRPVPALLQSLKVMGQQAHEEGRPGWTIICQRAIGCLERVAKDVTRFLEYPDLRVKHATSDMDLRIEVARLQEDGRVVCNCVTTTGECYTFVLDGLVASGPLDDFIRLAVTDLSRAVIEDAIATLDLKVLGPQLGLKPVAWLRWIEDENRFVLAPRQADDPGAFPVFRLGTGGTIDPAKVHALQVHPEYVMDAGGVGTTPAEDDGGPPLCGV